MAHGEPPRPDLYSDAGLLCDLAFQRQRKVTIKAP
jgi:hypothetical protein